MAEQTIVLITGCNRGIGLGLAEAYLARPQITLIAAVRDVSAPSLEALKAKAGPGSQLLVYQLDGASEERPAELAKELASIVPRIDIIVANAAVSRYRSVMETSSEDMRETFETNVLGPLRLFQATWPTLLSKATEPRFFAITSTMASIEKATKDPYLAYGVSKVALNFLSHKIHLEHPTCVSVAVHPGWVKTDMGYNYARYIGVNEPPMTLEQSISGMMTVFDNASRETSSGKSLTYSGEVIPW